MGKKTIRMYLHADKDTNFEKGESIGLKDEALRRFAYAFTEVEIICEVDTDTGDCELLAVDGRMPGAPVPREIDIEVLAQES